MKKIFIFLLLIIGLVGCSSGGSSTASNTQQQVSGDNKFTEAEESIMDNIYSKEQANMVTTGIGIVPYGATDRTKVDFVVMFTKVIENGAVKTYTITLTKNGGSYTAINQTSKKTSTSTNLEEIVTNILQKQLPN